MITQVVLLFMLSAVGLSSALCILVWSFAVTVDVRDYLCQTVDFISIASSIKRSLYFGAMTTSNSVFAIALGYAYLLLMHTSDFRWFLLFAVSLTCFFVLLWSVTVYVWSQTRRRPYLYHLPQDADELWTRNCKQGVMIMSTCYPKVFRDEDLVDTLSRSSSVLTRCEIIPQLKRQKGLKALKLTNDFAVYCNVCAEGYRQGYYGFLAAIEEAPDHLEAQRAILQAWPETAESQRLMDTIVAQFGE